MGVNGEESNACRINACYDEICANMALVAEKVLLEHGHAGYDTGFAAGGEGMEFEFGGDEGGREFGVCGGSSSGTPDLRRDVVKLLAVLEKVNQLRDRAWKQSCEVPCLLR